MEVKYFISASDSVYIKEENGLIRQIIRFIDNLCVDIINFEENECCHRREHSGQYEINQNEYEFWSDIAFRIKDFNMKNYSL